MTEYFEKYQYWIRINLAVEIFIKKGLRHFMHNVDGDASYKGLPCDPAKLYHEMILFKTNKEKSLRRIMKKDQWDTLCPSSKFTNSEDWDITLICVVILNTKDFLIPKKGWSRPPDNSDLSKPAAVLRSRQLRNDVKHGSLKDLSTKKQFLNKWKDIESILFILLDGNIFKTFQAFKTEDLSGFSGKAQKIVSNYIREGIKVSESQKTYYERLKELKDINQWMKEWKNQSISLLNQYENHLIDGSSLLNTNLTDIQAAWYTIRCSVAMENLTKWPIIFVTCKVMYGHVNVPPRDVHPGRREGFAFHKTSMMAGCWIKCSYMINNKCFHLSIHQPYNLNKSQNKLSMIINETLNISAEQLLEAGTRKEDSKSRDNTTMMLHDDDVCINGVMGTAYKTQCIIKIYPKKYTNLAGTVRKILMDPDTYSEFMAKKFNAKKSKKSLRFEKEEDDGLLLTGLSIGSSMQSISLKSLHLRSVDVTCAGCIENFTKWQLFIVRCDVMNGYTNCPFQDVTPGSKESFASHSRQHFGNGSYVRVTYSVDNNGHFIHLLYSLPSSFAVYTNMMAIMMSQTKDESTEDILKSCANQNFYGDVQPLCLKSERVGVSVVGVMGSAHKTNVFFTIYPLYFKHLAKHVKERMEKNKTSKALYEGFLESLSEKKFSLTTQSCF